MKEWEVEIVTGGGVGVRLNVGVFPTPFSYYPLFSVPHSKKIRYEHSLPPIRGLGKHSHNQKLMPMFNKRWVQCVSGGDRRGRKGVG